MRHSTTSRGFALMVLTALLLGAVPALAQDEAAAKAEPEESKSDPAEKSDPDRPELDPDGEDEDVTTKTKPADDRMKRYYEIRQSMRRQIQSGQRAVHIYQLTEEIADEIVADMRDLNPEVISPMALRKIALTPNLSQQFGQFVEATTVSSIVNNTDLAVKRCVACSSLRSRIEDGNWVVSLGLTEHEDLKREAKRLGVKSFLDLRFSYFPGAGIVAMQVEVVRADDGAIMWTETYRSDATSAAILRSGDRVLSRRERVKELERKLEARPYYGHILYTGAAHIPYDGPNGGITGASIGYRLYEKFGADRRWMFGVGAEGFANFSDTNGLLGSFVGASLLYELFEPDLNEPIYRTGPTINGFFAGTEGNSFAVEWGFDVTLQFRLGAGVSAMYFVPVTFAGADLGGFGYKARVSFNW